MTKKFPAKWLKRYPTLADISVDGWDDFFPNARAPWSEEEDAYLRTGTSTTIFSPDHTRLDDNR